MKSTLILCLGNEILSDDGFGCAVAAGLEKRLSLELDVEVEFASRAGYYLIERLSGCQRALIVDSVGTGLEKPGTLRFHSRGVFTPSNHLTCSHQLSLPTALELARHLAIDMPEEIDILTVEAADIETLSTTMTPDVAAAVDPAIERILNWINRRECHADLENRTTKRTVRQGRI